MRLSDGPRWRPWGDHLASDHVIDSTKSLTSRHGASARPSRAGRSSRFRASPANLNPTIVSLRRVVDGLDAKADPLVASLKKTSDQANLALMQATSTLAALQMTFAPDAPLTYRLNVALEDLSGASSAVRQLADYLQRNPSALVRGKYVSESHQ